MLLHLLRLKLAYKLVYRHLGADAELLLYGGQDGGEVGEAHALGDPQHRVHHCVRLKTER